MSKWKRVDKRGAPDWLYELLGAAGSSYWVRYRKEGIRLEKKIKGRCDTWVDARRIGQVMVDEARGAKTLGKEAPSLVRTEELCNEIVRLKLSKAPATYEQTEVFMRVHLVPWLNGHCPYATDLDSTVWERYKAQKRLENPTIALFNHWKFFVMLFKYAFEQGLLKKRYKLEFDEKREDFRKRGLIVTDAHMALLLKHANPIWRDRIEMQRFTGMRPGEVRRLQYDRVTLSESSCVIALKAEDTKTRSAREFAVTAPEVLEVIRRRLASAKGPFLFPARGNPQEAMERSLKGWETALDAASAEEKKEGRPPLPAYTPHDLRHTWLSKMFKVSPSPALICFKAGLSIEEAQATYLHFKAEDTTAIAEAARLAFGIGKNLGSEVTQAEVMVDK